MGKYDFFDQLQELTPGTSNAWAYERILPGSSVLELGCAVGILTKHLRDEKNCQVDVVEIDEEAGEHAAQYARRSWLGENGNLDQDCLLSIDGGPYDYVVALDVLEHLRDPAKVLAQARKLLKSSGVLLLSVPNIAHDAVVIDLFNSHFRYRELGLLDNTHISFFTHERLTDMLHEQAYRIRKMDALRKDVHETEIPVSLNDLPRDLRDQFLSRDYGDVYQFLVEADLDTAAPVCDELAKGNRRAALTALFYHRLEEDEEFVGQRCLEQTIALGPNKLTFTMPTKADAFLLSPARHNNCIRNLSIRLKTPTGSEEVAYTHNGILLAENTLAFIGDGELTIWFSAAADEGSLIQIDYELLVCDNSVINQIAEQLHSVAHLQRLAELAQADAKNAWAQFLDRDERLNQELVNSHELSAQLSLAQDDAKNAWAQFSDRDAKLYALQQRYDEQANDLQEERQKSERLMKRLTETLESLNKLNQQFVVRALKKVRIIKSH